MSIESAIDELYALPLDRFVAARAALSRTMSGADAKRVKALTKSTVVPWAVNQVYWHARSVYDEVLSRGSVLRRAQIAALEGGTADVRSAGASQRQAISKAVDAASRLAAKAGARPDADQLARMFEALSVVDSPPEPHGRFTKVIAPAGFEALSGVTVKVPARIPSGVARVDEGPAAQATRSPDAEAIGERQRAAKAAAAARRQQAARTRAEADLARAEAAERRARQAWERSKAARDAAERVLRALE